MAAILTLLAAVSASLHVRAEYLGPQSHVYVFKPLTTTLILLIAAQVQRSVSSRYKYLILAGLAFSLMGDVLLMFPNDLSFIAGLVSFLITHVCYIAAFRTDAGPRGFSWMWVPFAIYGSVMLGLLVPYLGQMLLPVIAYVVVILFMAWQGWERWAHTRHRGALFALVGALFFLVSDSALAIEKFRAVYAAAPLLVSVTYYTAQWFIARSVQQDVAA